MINTYVAFQVWMATSKNKGQSLAEYGLILALVAVFCIAALQLLGNSITNMMNGLSATINGIPTSTP